MMQGRSNSAPWNWRRISSQAAASADVSTFGSRFNDAATGAAPDRTSSSRASTSGPRLSIFHILLSTRIVWRRPAATPSSYGLIGRSSLVTTSTGKT